MEASVGTYNATGIETSILIGSGSGIVAMVVGTGIVMLVAGVGSVVVVVVDGGWVVVVLVATGVVLVVGGGVALSSTAAEAAGEAGADEAPDAVDAAGEVGTAGAAGAVVGVGRATVVVMVDPGVPLTRIDVVGAETVSATAPLAGVLTRAIGRPPDATFTEAAPGVARAA